MPLRCYRVGIKNDFNKSSATRLFMAFSKEEIFHAVLEFKTTTEQDMQDLNTSLTAGELGMFASQASFSSRMSSFKGTKNLQIYLHQEGGTDLKYD